MTPELNKVSNCCGDRIVTINDSEGTGHYECFACKKPCDGVQDCADCFPQHYPFSKGKTVPLCDKHYKEAIQKQPPEKTATYSGKLNKSVDFPVFIGAKKFNYSEKPYSSDDNLATLIGSLILNCGNLYNKNKEDITVEVSKFIQNNLINK
jgi:hypothetical protein